MELKVGDKVRVKSKENLTEFIEGFSDMFADSFAGKEVYVKTVSDESYEFTTLDSRQGFFVSKDYAELYVTKLDENKTKTSILSEELVKDLASIISKHNLSVKVEERDGGIFVKPIEKEEDDLPIDTFVMVQYNTSDWQLRKYVGHYKTIDINGKPDDTEKYPWDYIIPFDKFNPNDIKESLKYNIVK